MSLENLVYANRKLIDEYHTITKQQAEDSYKKSQMAMIVSFAVLIIGAVTVVRVDPLTSKVIIGTLTGLGSLLSGFIGRTFLESQRRVMTQLNYYFTQPLVTSYLLAAERVIGGMSEEVKDEVYMKVVDRLLTDEPLLTARIDQNSNNSNSFRKTPKVEVDKS